RCPDRRTRANKTLLAEGKALPPLREIVLRCPDFPWTFCTTCHKSAIPRKPSHIWMDQRATRPMTDVYTTRSVESVQADAWRMTNFLSQRGVKEEETGKEINVESLGK